MRFLPLLLLCSVFSWANAADAPAEVRAESFGFHEEDATSALQDAIDSGAKTVIVGNMGKPWIVRPIRLRSDLILIFEKGAEIVAKRGEYKRLGNSMFTARGASRIELRGEDNILRMWKSDYQQPPYEKSEWRHCLQFHSCSDVTISGLILEDSGGDGIYLGTTNGQGCDRFTIRNVKATNHHRQGISIINATDLLIEDCVFNSTDGTNPMAGIDFEPNHPFEKLSNCIVRRTVFNDNAHCGILFALGRLEKTSEPISVLIEDCTIQGNGTAARVVPRSLNGVGGKIEFRRCVFADSPAQGISVERKTITGMRILFDQCTFSNLATDSKEDAPIAITSTYGEGESIGGIELRDCVVNDPIDRRPIRYEDKNSLRLIDVTGTLVVQRGDKAEKIQLTQELTDTWFPWTVDLRKYTSVSLEGATLVPLEKGAANRFPAFPGWLRGWANFAITADAASQDLHFQIDSRRIGNPDEIPPIQVEVHAPDGEVSPLINAVVGTPSQYHFTAKKPGTYRIQINGGSHAVACSSETDRVNALATGRGFRTIGIFGPASFVVPAGTKSFLLRVAGGGGRELVHAIIRDSTGTVVAEQDNIGEPYQFPLQRKNADQTEVWTVELTTPSEGLIEDCLILMNGIPPILAPNAEGILVPKTN